MTTKENKNYELVILARPELTAKEVEELAARFCGILESQKATEIEVEHWGRRQIAFQINKYSSAHYVNIYFSANNSDLVSEVSALLKISEDILKFQFHKINTKTRKFQGNPLKLKTAA